jgi:hypothetical protein
MVGLALIGRGSSRSGRHALGALATTLAIAAGAPAAAVADAPANDAFATAQEITSSDAVVDGTTVDATRETGEPTHGGYSGSHSVWYRWVAPSSGIASFHASAEYALDPIVAVYTGSTVDGLTPVSLVDPFSGYWRPQRFRAVEGTAYLIALATEYADAYYARPFKLSVALGAPPPNDDLADAVELTGTDDTAAGNNRGATLEPGEVYGYNGYSTYPAGAGGRTIWYSWTAPSDGAATIDSAGSAVDTQVGVYTGDDVTGLIPVAGHNGAATSTGHGQARASFRAVAGTTYRIQVDTPSYITEGGDVALSLDLGPPPDNDAFADAVDLGSAGVAGADGRNDGASAEPGEPAHYPSWGAWPARSSAWYSWTAPEDGSLTIRATADFQTVLAAYTGDAVSDLTRVVNQPQAYNGGTEQIRIRVEAGVTYRIAVDSITTSATGKFSLALALTKSPANDDFADATALAGASVDVDSTNAGATQEPCEPQHELNYYDPSVWYEWTAPATGAVTLDVTGELSAAVGVYTGDDLCSLTRVTTARIGGSVTVRRFRAVAGVTYRIAIDGAGAMQAGFHLALRSLPRPANDDFAKATDLGSGATAAADGSNLGATSEAGEPAHYAYGWNAETPGSVWYTWKAPKRGSLTIRANAAFQAVLAAYTGDSPSGLTRVANQPQDYNGGSEQIRIRVEAGVTYRIAVDGGPATAGGDFGLALTLIDSPKNDDFANARVLAGADVQVDDGNVGATQEPCEPTHENNYYDPSVWYEWTAPADGRVKLEVTGELSNALIGVYTGADLCALARVTTTRFGGQRSFNAQAGVTYRIAVDGPWGRQNSFRLDLEQPDPPANDDFSAARTLTGTAALVDGTTDGATVEPGEPNPAGSNGVSVWYSWKAPVSGYTTLTLPWMESGSAALGVYTGDSVDALTEAPGLSYGYGYSPYGFQAVAGTTYRIAVNGGWTPAVGGFELGLAVKVTPPNDDFANAEELSGRSDSALGSNLGATLEDGEPANSAAYADVSVWYRWTAPTSESMTVNLGSYWSARTVTVYTGDALDALSTVAGRDHSVTFDATAGTTYHIAVDGWYSDSRGPFEITLGPSGGIPPEDDPPIQTGEPGDGGGGGEGGGTTETAKPKTDTRKDPPVVRKPFRVYPSFGQQNIRGLLSHGLRGLGRCTRTCTVDIQLVIERKVVRKLKLPKSLGLGPIGRLRVGGNVYSEIRVKLARSAQRKLRALEDGLPLLVKIRAVTPNGVVATATKYLHLNP